MMFDSEYQPSRPKINYPCLWAYRIVGTCEAEMRTAVADILKAYGSGEERAPTLETANMSGTGKYLSMHLELLVKDESHRNAIFAALSNHEHIRFVL